VNKKVKALALQSVLTEKLNKKEIIFVDNIKFDSPSTKQFVSMLKKLNIDSKALVVIQSKDRNVEKSAMNLKNARVITIDGLNTYELINNKYVIMTLESLKNIQKNKEN
jgi:large subunit ribosomal protein L4